MLFYNYQYVHMYVVTRYNQVLPPKKKKKEEDTFRYFIYQKKKKEEDAISFFQEKIQLVNTDKKLETLIG